MANHVGVNNTPVVMFVHVPVEEFLTMDVSVSQRNRPLSIPLRWYRYPVLYHNRIIDAPSGSGNSQFRFIG